MRPLPWRRAAARRRGAQEIIGAASRLESCRGPPPDEDLCVPRFPEGPRFCKPCRHRGRSRGPSSGPMPIVGPRRRDHLYAQDQRPDGERFFHGRQDRSRALQSGIRMSRVVLCSARPPKIKLPTTTPSPTAHPTSSTPTPVKSLIPKPTPVEPAMIAPPTNAPIILRLFLFCS